ncbi:protein of unknown function [Paenibacillus alvei]|uniref:Uncharacterized protein n=1 Tax=Paenibacillus alvei TaxID=44250 RepID=A0A383R650_PAEAL|nr:protein of unknown function [Paenibacillus alvei]
MAQGNEQGEGRSSGKSEASQSKMAGGYRICRGFSVRPSPPKIRLMIGVHDENRARTDQVAAWMAGQVAGQVAASCISDKNDSADWADDMESRPVLCPYLVGADVNTGNRAGCPIVRLQADYR